MPASSVPQHVLHCIFVTMAAGFDSMLGIYISLINFFTVFFVGWEWSDGRMVGFRAPFDAGVAGV